jgi:hypothetical protein
MFPFMFPFRFGRHMHFGLIGGLLRLLLVIFGIKYLVDHTGKQQPTYVPSRPVDGQPPSSNPGDVTKHSSGPEPAPDPFVGPAE